MLILDICVTSLRTVRVIDNNIYIAFLNNTRAINLPTRRLRFFVFRVLDVIIHNSYYSVRTNISLLHNVFKSVRF